jgi:Protein of unknown function (DUF3298)
MRQAALMVLLLGLVMAAPSAGQGLGGDAELARAETQVASALAAASARLSGTGRARLRDDQAAWHKTLETLCPGQAESAACLTPEYEQRRSQLARAVAVAGNVTFYRAERFEIRPAANAESHPVRIDIAWPLLDHATGRQLRWNEAMAKAAEALAEPPDKALPEADVTIDYRIESVLPGLIQAVISREFYIHGAEHGDDLQLSSLYLLQAGRMLEAEDLFDQAKAWRSALARAAFDRLQAAAEAGGWTLWPKEPEEIGSLTADPERWLIGKDGLALHFDAYDLADYAAGPQMVVIPWAELAPLLKVPPAVKLPP